MGPQAGDLEQTELYYLETVLYEAGTKKLLQLLLLMQKVFLMSGNKENKPDLK